jgi:membrane fusion protein
MQPDNTLYRQSAWQALTIQQHGRALLLPSLKAWIICAVLLVWVVAALALLTTHSFTEKSTVAGYISATEPSISVSPKESVGLITHVYVENGQQVTSGQRLLTIKRPTQMLLGDKGMQARQNLLYQQMTLLELTQTQLEQGFEQQQGFLSQQRASAETQQLALNQQVEYVNQRIEITQEQLDRLGLLISRQLISHSAFNDARQSLLSLQQLKSQLKQQLSDNSMTLAQLNAQHAKLLQQSQQQQTQTELSQLPLKRQLSDLEVQQSYTLYATRSGVISNLHAQPGDDVARFPVLLKLSGLDQSLLLQLLVPASAAGFIQTEQNVRVRLDAFPHQKYGTLNATVSKVASTITLPNESQAHAVPLQQPVFLVQAELERSYIYAKGNPISLKEGMTVQADVVLSERSLLEWLLSPLYSLKGNL